MKITIVTPAPPRSRHGNRGTAMRWMGLLSQLGHEVSVSQQYGNQACEVLIALHGRKSYDSIRRFAERHPERPLIVALTGTDIYIDVPEGNAQALRSIDYATKLVTLQPLAVNNIPEQHREKVRAIFQSAVVPAERSTPEDDVFEVCVAAHLRPVKDPLRVAEAVRDLPETSKIKVSLAGTALEDGLRISAQDQSEKNPRFEWIGQLTHEQTLHLMTRSRLLVISSLCEGGPTVLSEAIAIGLPVLATRVDGNVGMLGDGYPGYFEIGDTAGLRELLLRAERDSEFYESLAAGIAEVAEIVNPALESESWRQLLDELPC